MDRYYTSPAASLTPADFQELVRMALAEDCPDHDVTSEAIFSDSQMCKALLVSRETGVLAGTPVLEELKNQLGNFEYTLHLKDGEVFHKGDKLLSIQGRLVIVLRLERILLNFLQYLSGIATEANKVSSKYGTSLLILDTRKTLPGYRKLAKYAVYTGGAANHRQNLSDMALIKDNHVAMSGSIEEAVLKVRNKFPDKKIELEIDGLHQLDSALNAHPDIIMLDNFSIEDTKLAVDRIRNRFSDIKIECSGGITPEKLTLLAEIGGIGVSMGYLTHTTRFLDLSLEIES